MADYSKMTTEELLDKLSTRGLIRYLEREGLLTKSKISPLMNQATIAKARAELMDAQTQGGHSAKVNAYRKVALPLLGRDVPFRPDGTVDDEKFSLDMHEALDAAERMQAKAAGIQHPLKKEVTTEGPRGEKTTKTSHVNPLTGEALGGGEYVSESKSVNISEGAEKKRKEIEANKTLERTRIQQSAVTQMKGLATKQNPTNQDDLALIYSTVRALDPDSAVRDGEISLLKKGAGLPATLVNNWNRIFGNPNAVLTPEIRNNLLGLAQTQAESSMKTAVPELRKYYNAARAEGLKLNEVFTDEQLDALVSHGGLGGGGTSPAPQPSAAPAQSPKPVGSADNPFPFMTDEDVKNAPADAEFIIDKRQGKPPRVFYNPNYKKAPAASAATSSVVPSSPVISPSDVNPTQ